MTIQRFENGPRMSRVVVYNDTVYVRLTADTTAGAVGEQTKEILAKIDALKQGGTDNEAPAGRDPAADAHGGRIQQGVDAWVCGRYPARACIEARLQSPAR